MHTSDFEERVLMSSGIMVQPDCFFSASLDDDKFALLPIHPERCFRVGCLEDVPVDWMQKLFWALSAVPRSLYMPGAGMKEHSVYSMRFESQERGMLHVHVLFWVHLDPANLSPSRMDGMGLVSIAPAERHRLVELRS